MPDNSPARPRDIIPSPDPSTLTTEQLHDMERQLRREIECAVEITEVRLAGLEKEVASLKELHAEKFDSVQKRLDDSKTALDAAFLAQKGNAEKTEISLTKQIDFMGDRINEVKERLDRGEGATSGASITRTEAHLSSGQMIATIVAGFVGFGLLLSVVEFAVRTH